jgi:hypothetical protein
MRAFLSMFTMGLNFSLPYSILLAFPFLPVILDILLCSLLVLQAFPSARCASAANTVCRDVHIFKKQIVILKYILK